MIEDAVNKKELILLKDFLEAKQSIYTKSWVPTPWEVVSWGLRQLGVIGGDPVEDRLVTGDFVIKANVEVWEHWMLGDEGTDDHYRQLQRRYLIKHRRLPHRTLHASSPASSLRPHSHRLSGLMR